MTITAIPFKAVLAVSFLSLTAPLFWSGLSGPEKAIQAYYEVQPACPDNMDPEQIVSADKANTMGIGFVPRDISDTQVAQMPPPMIGSPIRVVAIKK